MNDCNHFHNGEIMPKENVTEKYRCIIERIETRREDADRSPKVLMKIEQRQFSSGNGAELMDEIRKKKGSVIVLKKEKWVSDLDSDEDNDGYKTDSERNQVRT